MLSLDIFSGTMLLPAIYPTEIAYVCILRRSFFYTKRGPAGLSDNIYILHVRVRFVLYEY